MFEAVDEVYQILLPILKANRDYKRLASTHRCVKIVNLFNFGTIFLYNLF